MPSAIRAIAPTVDRVVGRLEKLGVLDGHRDAIQVALNEALANAVLHGNRKRTDKRVRVACYRQRDAGSLLVVRDSGRGFDPARIPNPTAESNVTGKNGRGIFLIRHFMDEVHFANDGREIRMRKRLVSAL